MQNKLLKFFLFMGMVGLLPPHCFADKNKVQDINATLMMAMEAYHVPVVGYAIIKNYQIIASHTLSIDPNLKVSKNSLFQAASISKSVSSYGALKLVSQGKLNLDTPVNERLTTWKIPENEYTQDNPVTLRQMLDMTSGLSVSGFPGHQQGDPLPTLQEVLDGKSPANTAPIRVFHTPGAQYFYSGGAFQVLEQLMEDITQQPFQEWMKREVLEPLKMDQSVFQYPLIEKLHPFAVPGFLTDKTMIKGGWNNYVIAGSGGLWSTPTDLAKFAIDISNSYLGKSHILISKLVATQMLTRQDNTDYGLGVAMNGEGQTLNFRKAGHNLGYHSQMLMFPNTGEGIVMMTNSEQGEYVINYMIPLIAQKYNWPCYFPFFDELISIPKEACGREGK
jgi:CubicO group peptidase (beta-lactamase class C family)